MEKLKNQVSAQAFALDNAIYTIDELQEKLMSPEEEAEKSLWDSKPIEELRDMHAKKKAEFESHEKEFEKAKSELEDIRDQIYTLKTSQGAVLKKSSSLPKDRLPILSTYETSDSPFFNTLREQRKKLETALGIVNQRLNQVDERTRLKSEFLRYENSVSSLSFINLCCPACVLLTRTILMDVQMCAPMMLTRSLAVGV